MSRRDVWRIDRAGSLNRLTRRTEDLPPPASGEARVVVKAIGLNFADIFACLGLYSATPTGSFIPGLEFAGMVEAVGERGAESGDPHGMVHAELRRVCGGPAVSHATVAQLQARIDLLRSRVRS